MKVSLLALLGLFVLVDASASVRAEESEKRAWRLDASPVLVFGHLRAIAFVAAAACLRHRPDLRGN